MNTSSPISVKAQARKISEIKHINDEAVSSAATYVDDFCPAASLIAVYFSGNLDS